MPADLEGLANTQMTTLARHAAVVFLTLSRCLVCGFAVLVLAATSAAAAPIDDDPEPSPVAVVNAFTEALNARALDRAEALLSDNATVADERGEYVGDAAREWLVRTSNDGMHLRLVNVSRIDTDERGTPGHTTWWLIFTVAVSSDADRNLGYTPYTGEASAILGGSLIHSFRLQPLSPPFQPLIDAPVPPTERPGEFAGWPSPWPPVVIVTAVSRCSAYSC